jgi:hypothetical protein
MGVDIYLNSIWNPWVETHRQDLLNPETSDADNIDDFIHDILRRSNEVFDKARSSGGYFRNGYNAGDVMWAMGLSWRNDVGAMLDSECRLPIDHARDLFAKIEARPLTRERIAQHIFEHITNGVLEHPVTGHIQDLLTDAANGDTRPLAPPDLDELSGFLCKRRDELLVILRKSIELGEPLVCSL